MALSITPEWQHWGTPHSILEAIWGGKPRGFAAAVVVMETQDGDPGWSQPGFGAIPKSIFGPVTSMVEALGE